MQSQTIKLKLDLPGAADKVSQHDFGNLPIIPDEWMRAKIIIDRADLVARCHGITINKRSALMDLLYCHHMDRSINLLALVMSCDDDVAHDIFGLIRFFDRKAFRVTQGFHLRHELKKDRESA